MLRRFVGLLMFLEPLRFASEALSVIWTITHRGALAALELAVHGAIAAVCAAAGLALWNESPGRTRLATIAILAAVTRAAQSVYWSTLPNSTPPGDEWLVAATAIGLGALALVVIARAEKQS